MKRRLLFFVCLLCILMSADALAFDYPNGFWSVNTEYENALASNNHYKIIESGSRIIELFSNLPESDEKKGILISRYNQLGLSYAEIGEYDNSAKMFRALCDYAYKYGNEYFEYTRGAEARILQYASDIRLYTDGGTSTYYGAVNEKPNGVLFGLCANGETQSRLQNESMVLTYQELGQHLIPYNVGVMEDASAEGLAVEFALNCPNQGYDVKNIQAMEPYLKEISDLLASYSDVPVYLRFGAEFDVWTIPADPEEFKFAFRYVSDYFKRRNSNVAMVWSPNQVSGWYVNVDDFYPGDEYVDWVGMSLYAQKYFLGDPNQSELDQIFFRSGINSNPVIAVKNIVEKYGNRKPIMLSECGCGHRIIRSGENTTDFALQRLKEFYSYLPMVYPQIKLIAYFDWYISASTEYNDFRLSSNPEMQDEYLSLTSGRRFIQWQYDNNTDFCYRQISNGITVDSTFEVSCYAHLYNAGLQSVSYFVDDVYAGGANKLPYTAVIDASAYTGLHTLKAVAVFDNGKTLETSSSVYINGVPDKVTVKIDGQKISFDQDPVIYNSRTMVPMRKIFEVLGADITWNQDTQTVTAVKGDRTISVTIGQKIMYVNDNAVMLDTEPFILSGRTLVPVRAVAEGLGCGVEWYGASKLVSITSDRS